MIGYLWDDYPVASIILNCVNGFADLQAYAALVAAFVLMLRPDPKPSEGLTLPEGLLNTAGMG